MTHVPASGAPLWRPSARAIEAATLTRLARRLGVADYDALYRLSIASPARYWEAVMQELGFAWRTAPTQFMAPGDPRLPQWFVGGERNAVDALIAHAAQAPRRAAIVCESEAGEVRTLDYEALAHLVLQLAGGLRAQGVTRGARVGLMLPMGVEAVAGLLALAALGAVAVPLFTGYGAEAVRTRLELAGARHLLVGEAATRRGRPLAVRPLLQALQAQMPGLRMVLHAGQAGHGALPPSTQAWDCLLQAPALTAPETMAASDPLMIVFTSGTTGRPKGTVHTHAGFPLKIAHDCACHFELHAGDRWLWPSDMGWIVGPITTFGAMSRGATLVCYDGAPDHPTPARMGALIDRHAVTHFGASPTLIRALAPHGSGVAPRGATLRVLMVAGEVIDAEHFNWFAQHFGRGEAPLINYSGGTEAAGALLANVPVRPIKAAGFNSASPGVAAYAADARGERLCGSVGELAIAAPFIGMTQGFWQDTPRYFDTYWSTLPGVWLHGDLVMQDADGHFFILGRSDDTLKIAGKRVGPAEIEDVVLACPGVREAAAVGLPDADKGQRLVLCVVPEVAGDTQLPARVAVQVQSALGKPFAPSQVHSLAALPRTRNGKLMRRVVRQLLAGEPPGDLSSLDNPDSLELLRALAQRAS